MIKLPVYLMNEIISMDEGTTISVILPVYNGGDYLVESVESVLKQDLQNFELLIVDDCSTDRSYEYLQGLTDRRIKLFKNEKNRGLFYNLNLLIGKSKSSLIKLWSQDDIMYRDCLSSFVSFFQQHPQIGFCYSDRDMIDEAGNIKKSREQDKTPSIISPSLHARIAYFTGSIAGNIANVCISRRAMNSVGNFNEQMKFSADFDMWVRLAKEHETGFIKKKIIQLRDHEQQLSRNVNLYINNIKDDLQVYKNLNSYVAPGIKAEGAQLMRKYKLPFYYTLMMKSFLHGQFKAGFIFLKELAAFDNFFLLSISYLRNKMLKPSMPEFLKFESTSDN